LKKICDKFQCCLANKKYYFHNIFTAFEKGYIGMVVVNGFWLLLMFCCLTSWSFKLNKLNKSFDHWNLVPVVITVFWLQRLHFFCKPTKEVYFWRFTGSFAQVFTFNWNVTGVFMFFVFLALCVCCCSVECSSFDLYLRLVDSVCASHEYVDRMRASHEYIDSTGAHSCIYSSI